MRGRAPFPFGRRRVSHATRQLTSSAAEKLGIMLPQNGVNGSVITIRIPKGEDEKMLVEGSWCGCRASW
eukprot:scaffold88904_cov28-Tisochrysis_lutea.AAC.1